MNEVCPRIKSIHPFPARMAMDIVWDALIEAEADIENQNQMKGVKPMKTKVKKSRKSAAKVSRETRATTGGTPVPPEQIIHIPLGDIAPDPEQPRKAFPKAELLEMAASINAIGVQQPIVVKANPRYELLEPDLTDETWRIRQVNGHLSPSPSPQSGEGSAEPWPSEKLAKAALGARNALHPYTLIFGERRWRASQLAGKETIPAIVRNGDLQPKDLFNAQIVENEARADLSLAEKGAAYQRAIDQGFHTIGSLMTLTGLKHSAIYNRLALNKAAPAVQAAVNEGKLPASIAVFITRIPGHKLQAKALKEILEGGAPEAHGGRLGFIHTCMSAREAERFISAEYSLALKEAKFDPEDKELDPIAGPCGECPYRSGNNREAYADVKDPQTCMNPDCFKHKTDVWRERELAKAREDGATVLTAKESKPLFSGSYFQGYGQGYTMPDYKVTSDPKERTAGQLVKALGKDAPTRTVAVDGRGGVVTLYRESEVYEACVQAKIIKEPKKGGATVPGAAGSPESRLTGETPEQKAKRELQRRIDDETATLSALAVVAKIEGIKSTKGEAEFLRWLIEWSQEWQDAPWEVISDRRGLERGELRAMLAKLDVPALRGFLAELQLIGYDGVNHEALEMADYFWTVDRKGIGQAVRKELKGSAVVPTVVDGVPPDTSEPEAVARDAQPSEPEARAPRKKTKQAKAIKSKAKK